MYMFICNNIYGTGTTILVPCMSCSSSNLTLLNPFTTKSLRWTLVSILRTDGQYLMVYHLVLGVILTLLALVTHRHQ